MFSPSKRPSSPSPSTDPSNPKRIRLSSLDPENRTITAAPSAPGSTTTSLEARLIRCEEKIERLLWNAVRVSGMQDAVVGVMNDMTDVSSTPCSKVPVTEPSLIEPRWQRRQRPFKRRTVTLITLGPATTVLSIASRCYPFRAALPRFLAPLVTPLPPPLVLLHPYEPIPIPESAYSLFNTIHVKSAIRVERQTTTSTDLRYINLTSRPSLPTPALLPPQPTPAGQVVNMHDDDDIESGSTTESDTDSPHPDFTFKPTFYKVHRALVDEDYESGSTTESDTDTPDANFVKIKPKFYSIPTGSSSSDLSDDIFDALFDGDHPSSPMPDVHAGTDKSTDALMQQAEFLVERVASRVDCLEHEVNAQRTIIDDLLRRLSEEETLEASQSRVPDRKRKRGRSATPPQVPPRFARRYQRRGGVAQEESYKQNMVQAPKIQNEKGSQSVNGDPHSIVEYYLGPSLVEAQHQSFKSAFLLGSRLIASPILATIPHKRPTKTARSNLARKAYLSLCTMSTSTLPTDITPSMLLNNTRHLLHNKPDNIYTYSAYDGQCGAVIDEGHYFITSPNFKTIYEPPIGSDRKVYLRENYRYGPDNPLQWPQPFVPYYLHLCAIRLPVRDTTDLMWVMWWKPEPAQFVGEDALISGLGRIEPNMFQLIKTSRRHRIIPELLPLLKDYVYCVEHVTTTFDAAVANVHSLQRLFIKLLALLDYLEKFRPMMIGQTKPADDKLAVVMRAFVYDIQQAENLMRARIRVWLIRPFRELRNARIRRVVDLRTAESTIPVKPTTDSTVIYTGPATDLNKYRMIHTHLRKTLRYPNPFANSPVRPDANAPSGVTLTPQHPVHFNTHNPTAGSAGRDKFVDPLSNFFPPAIDSWKASQLSVNRGSNYGGAAAGVALGYVFPEPAGIVSAANVERQREMLKGWLACRTAVIFSVTSNASNAAPVPAAMWKKLISLEFQHSKADNTRSAKLEQQASKLLQSCLNNINASSTQQSRLRLKSSSLTSTWRGIAFENLTDQHLEEVLWELSELNFRFELIALDARASGTSAHSTSIIPGRQAAVEACFPIDRYGSLFTVEINQANRGLGSFEWRERGKYVVALRDLMKDWTGSKPSSFDLTAQKNRLDEKEVQRLKADVTAFYTTTFFQHFRHATIIPRRLGHDIPLAPPVPPPGTLKIMNPRPHLFYDLSKIVIDPQI
ncbi:hypothetical protein BDN72DRAFT_860683 [Pluteus cervinus]|uniref:Uncharacterized protein n=1 Tax=Pluteus cervinus TaxID=181527 RepID=A0ACD3AKF9_9AGAR|nr:hypothetical protein BDN72DRAFT_860683 [Pluteus cervinus]